MLPHNNREPSGPALDAGAAPIGLFQLDGLRTADHPWHYGLPGDHAARHLTEHIHLGGIGGIGWGSFVVVALLARWSFRRG